MSLPNLPDQFFTVETLGTASGCALAVYVVVNGIRKFGGYDARWLPLATAGLIVFGLYSSSGQPWTFVSTLILIINTFLVAFAALGFQETTVRGISQGGGGPEFTERHRPWRSSWLD